jgi:hypothetical protein
MREKEFNLMYAPFSEQKRRSRRLFCRALIGRQEKRFLFKFESGAHSLSDRCIMASSNQHVILATA